MDNFKKYAFYLLIIAVVAVTGFYVWKDWNSTKNIDNGENIGQNQEEQKSSENQGGAEITGGEVTTVQTNIPAPDLNRSINITAKITDEVKSLALTKIEEYKKKIQASPTNSENWIIIGIYYKTLGDFNKSKDVWEYAKAIDPKNFIPYNNLGDLYAYFLKDNVKAEENFKKALGLAPSEAFLYRSVADFYRYVMKDPVKADAILKGVDNLK